MSMMLLLLEMRFVVAHNYTFKISPHLEGRRRKSLSFSFLLSRHAAFGLNSYLVQLSHDPNERRGNDSSEWELKGKEASHTYEEGGRKFGPALSLSCTCTVYVGDLIASPSRFRLLLVLRMFLVGGFLTSPPVRQFKFAPNGVRRVHRPL